MQGKPTHESPARESPTRERTRTAILQAGVRVLSRNPAASVAEIAGEAGVARSTLHRYYPDRASLEGAMRQFVEEESRRAVERARIGEGSGIDAFTRLCHEYVDMGEMFVWLWHHAGGDDAAAVDDLSRAASEEDFDPETALIVKRGHEDGSIDPRLPAIWVTHLLWSTLYGTWGYQKQNNVSRQEVRELCVTALRRALSPPAPSVAPVRSGT